MKELDQNLLRELSRVKAPGCPPIAALGNFLDEKLDPTENRAIEAHLRSCPCCTTRLIDLRELARLEKDGDEPPAELVEKVKLLVRSPQGEAVGSPTPLTQVSKLLYKVWVTLAAWRVPRFAAELAVACGAVLIVLRIGGWTISRGPSGTQEIGVSQIENVVDLSSRERTILASLSLASADLLPLDKRIVSALEKLPKTLLLEESRGPNDVEIYKRAAPATVLVVTDRSLGSGVTVDSSGDVITNWHVIEAAKKIAVVFKPERGVAIKKELAYAATPIKVDQVTDLAFLKVNTPSKNVAFLPFASMTQVEVGQDVHAIGHPDGEVWTYTTGVISQIRPGYQWTGADNLLHQSKVIQTQTAINPGNSGGPLLNDRGEIIGINSFRKEGEGLNYAVAADVVSEFLKRNESRAAPVVPRSAPASYRVERYGRHIVGAYLHTTVPPPDLWLVYRDAGGRDVQYAVTGSAEKMKLDTVIEAKNDDTLSFYIDTDCDGTIDLIGYADAGGDTMTRYERPENPPRLSEMIGELVAALKNRAVPYGQLQVCQ